MNAVEMFAYRVSPPTCIWYLAQIDPVMFAPMVTGPENIGRLMYLTVLDGNPPVTLTVFLDANHESSGTPYETFDSRRYVD